MTALIDVHMHLYTSQDSARWALEGYEISEYGSKEGVRFANAPGVVEEAAAKLARSELAHAVVLNLFAPDSFRDEAIAGLPAVLDAEERRRRIDQITAGTGDAMVRFNEWLMASIGGRRGFTPFIGIDPYVRSADANVAHLREMAERGARGVKLHPVMQHFFPDDPRMMPVYQTCVELGLTVLSHSGRTQRGEQWAAPFSFGPVMEQIPDLRLVLAHLGGGAWRETLEFATTFPAVTFDLSEIIHWLGASESLAADAFVDLIRSVGVERVMFGSDYPWYDPIETLELLTALPGLSDGERDAIAGQNAAAILELPL
jgi:uncharacterized protein